MLPSFTKSSKPLYLYDEKTKELLYISASQTDMGKAIGITASNFSSYTKKNILYLNRFIFSTTPLDSEKYYENLLDIETLKDYVGGINTNYKKELIKNVESSRQASALKRSICIEMTNIKTNEVLTFNQVTGCANYLNKLNPDYKCLPAMVSDYSKNKDRLYKGIF